RGGRPPGTRPAGAGGPGHHTNRRMKKNMAGVTIDLGGRVAVVTGGGSGIGEATAKLLARANAAVVVADLAEDAAKRVAAEIEEAGGRALAVALDVADPVSVAAGLARVRGELGPGRILVNNAAPWVLKLFA